MKSSIRQMPKKCEYIGLYSAEGCNEDAAPGERFCRRHLYQGRGNEITRNIWACGCLGGILLTIIATVAVVCTSSS